jgi:hypothetical protein
MELVKAGGYGFFFPCDGPRNSYLFLPAILNDIELDMPVLNTAFIYVQIFNGSYSHHGIRSEY